MVDQSIMLGFVEEAQSYTPTIRAGIEIFQADATRLDDIQLAYRQIHTIKGAALMVGLDELSELANGIESALEPYQEGAGQLSARLAQDLLMQLGIVEFILDSSVNELRESVASAGDSPEEFDAADESAARQPNAEARFSNEILDDDVDPEMLEVFALEAEEHLQIISANLEILRENPQHREALQNIRRSSHTLKGAAGVVGFKTTSGLAHRMEDLLDHLAENAADSNAQTTALLLASTDALEKLSRGTTPQQLAAEIGKLYQRYDELFGSQTAAAPAPQIETAAVPAIADKPAIAVIAAPPPVEVVAPRMMVRVGLERLDEMTKLMGEMVISRTTLEQRLKEIESQVSEMRLSTNRLRRIAGKLEIDYEANQLRSSSLGVQIAGSLSNQNGAFLNSAVLENPKSKTQNTKTNHGFDDLEFDQYTEFHQLTRELVETSTDTSSITGELDDLLGDLEGLLTRQRRLADELQDKLMRVRMVPLDSLETRLNRTVRVAADSENRAVELEIQGGDVEIDTQVLSALAEPLLHLLRNAVVHGIEPPEERRAAGKNERGNIRLNAAHEGTHILLSITDDGRGMNPEKLRNRAVSENFITYSEAAALTDDQALSLIYLPGFSTAGKLSEVAGRGVGMDIVRDSVLRQQGTISLRSNVGRGTTISIRLPMSLTVTRSLIVRAFGQAYAIPLNMISQLSQVAAEDFDQLTEEKIVWVDGKFYPVFTLNDLLELPALADRDTTLTSILLIKSAETTFALALDEVVEAREIVIKPLNNPLKSIAGLLGATILGDGAVVTILDLPALFARNNDKLRAIAAQVERPTTPAPALSKPRQAQISVMVVDDSPSVRRVMSNFVTKSGMQVITAKDGLEAIEILQTLREMPDVILSDVEMPRMDGYELLATLKRQGMFSNIPIIMITSRAGEKHRRKAMDLGASEYVTKPYEDAVLLNAIRQLAKR